MATGECRQCGQVAEYVAHQGRICRPCRREYNNQWHHANGGGKRRSYKDYALRKLYNISYDEYMEMLTLQGNVCAICKRPETRKSSGSEPKYLSVDHDHVTGKVRALLCHDCNVALGYLKDDPTRIAGLLDYLDANS